MRDKFEHERRQRRADRHIDRILRHLRHQIRAKGFTQMEVQEALGWGRRYISELLTKQKGIRVEQVVMMLDVIGVDPAAFFGEIFGLDEGAPIGAARQRQVGRIGQGQSAAMLREIRSEYDTLVRALTGKGVIKPSELKAYVQRARALGSESAWTTM